MINGVRQLCLQLNWSWESLFNFYTRDMKKYLHKLYTYIQVFYNTSYYYVLSKGNRTLNFIFIYVLR